MDPTTFGGYYPLVWRTTLGTTRHYFRPHIPLSTQISQTRPLLLSAPNPRSTKSCWCHNFKIHEAAKRGCRDFVIDAVKDTWIRDLHHAKTIYAEITTKSLMYHLQLHYRGLHVLEFVNLTSDIITYYGDVAGVPRYINMIEDSQKKE